MRHVSIHYSGVVLLCCVAGEFMLMYRVFSSDVNVEGTRVVCDYVQRVVSFQVLNVGALPSGDAYVLLVGACLVCVTRHVSCVVRSFGVVNL